MPLSNSFLGALAPMSVSENWVETNTPPMSPSSTFTLLTSSSMLPFVTSNTLLFSCGGKEGGKKRALGERVLISSRVLRTTPAHPTHNRKREEGREGGE